MEIYADPRARGDHGRTRADPATSNPPAGLWSVQTSLHGARSAHLRSERRRQVASFDGDAAGARGHLSVASSVVPRGGRGAERADADHITHVHSQPVWERLSPPQHCIRAISAAHPATTSLPETLAPCF
jgi:hypothetical protein